MFNKIVGIRLKAYLFLSVFSISGCVNSDSSQVPFNQDYCNLIAETINFDRLQQYYHIDVFPERSPLIVVVEKMDFKCAGMVKFGKQVKLLSKSDASSQSNEAYLEFTKVDITNNVAITNFNYGPEGIRGEIKFVKINSVWKVDESFIVEL